MDGLERLLEELKRQGLVAGHFRGLLHVIIGRKITLADGSIISTGLTWRMAADLLRRMRWPPELVRELEIDPDSLPPRDRQRFWFGAIAQARVDSQESIQAGDELAAKLEPLGYFVGAPPRTPT
jgi:hypothetical protein